MRNIAELTVKFKANGFSSAARSLGRSFDTRYNDYQGIRKKVLNETSSRSYLNSSSSYLQKKMDSLDSKRDKLKAFKTNMENFCEEAKRADKRVATRVKRDAKDVYKKLGIKTGFWATTAAFFKGAGKAIWNGLKDTWGAIKAGAKTVWNAVKEWYQKHKKIILTILTVIATAVVIAALIILAPGVLLLIGKLLLCVGAFALKLGAFNMIVNIAIDAKNRLKTWLGLDDRLVYTHKEVTPAKWGKETGTISTYEYMLLSELAYNSDSAKDIEDEIIRRYPGAEIEHVSDSLTGFAYTIIKLDDDNAIVAFRGSDDWKDWTFTNAPSVAAGQNIQAMEAKKLIDSLPYSNIQVTGHSLGGYLAIEVALTSDKVKECVVFNALARSTGKELLQNYRNSEAAKKITQYRTSKDPASSSLTGIRIGTTITIPYKGWDPIKAHDLDNFTDRKYDHEYPGRKSTYRMSNSSGGSLRAMAYA